MSFAFLYLALLHSEAHDICSLLMEREMRVDLLVPMNTLLCLSVGEACWDVNCMFDWIRLAFAIRSCSDACIYFLEIIYSEHIC